MTTRPLRQDRTTPRKTQPLLSRSRRRLNRVHPLLSRSRLETSTFPLAIRTIHLAHLKTLRDIQADIPAFLAAPPDILKVRHQTNPTGSQYLATLHPRTLTHGTAPPPAASLTATTHPVPTTSLRTLGPSARATATATAAGTSSLGAEATMTRSAPASRARAFVWSVTWARSHSHRKSVPSRTPASRVWAWKVLKSRKVAGRVLQELISTLVRMASRRTEGPEGFRTRRACFTFLMISYFGGCDRARLSHSDSIFRVSLTVT